MLYYARSEVTEKDYFVKELNLNDILIIEDDKKIREELSKLLNSYGYHTILVNEFLNILDYINSSISLVLLDINLPYEMVLHYVRKLKIK